MFSSPKLERKSISGKYEDLSFSQNVQMKKAQSAQLVLRSLTALGLPALKL